MSFSHGTHNIDDSGRQKLICGSGMKVIPELMKIDKLFGPIDSEYAILAYDILQKIGNKIKIGTVLWVLVNLQAGEAGGLSLPVINDNCQHW